MSGPNSTRTDVTAAMRLCRWTASPISCSLRQTQPQAAVSARRIEDLTETAEALGIRKVMDFIPLEDPESKLQHCGVSWQEGGTDDVYLSVAILFGTGVGNQGGAAGSITDNAGCVIRIS